MPDLFEPIIVFPFPEGFGSEESFYVFEIIWGLTHFNYSLNWPPVVVFMRRAAMLRAIAALGLPNFISPALLAQASATTKTLSLLINPQNPSSRYFARQFQRALQIQFLQSQNVSSCLQIVFRIKSG